MPSTIDELLDAVLELPVEDRARVAREIVRSLDDEAADAGVDEAWASEIEQRVAELLEGSAELAPANEVLQELRAELRTLRNK